MERVPTGIQSAEVVLPCAELDETLAFFTERLGLRIEAVFPADEPSVAVVSGHGLRIRLQRGAGGDPGVLRLECADLEDGTHAVVAPNGTRIELVPKTAALKVPPLVPEFVITRMEEDAAWTTGRAGMQYRDLIPGRQGGRFIASHIRIPGGGPVPDYVHYHLVRFQMIYCARGWVRVVYEDQGADFVLQAGDCVLQPPRIRHRVLESSPGLEVIELGCPAQHETRVDHGLELPMDKADPERRFDGQRFVRHVAAEATWGPARLPGFESRDTGIAAATRGVASVSVLRPRGADTRASSHAAELLFHFVLDGRVTLDCEGQGVHTLEGGDSFVLPSGLRHELLAPSPELRLLEVALPGTFTTTLVE